MFYSECNQLTTFSRQPVNDAYILSIHSTYQNFLKIAFKHSNEIAF